MVDQWIASCGGGVAGLLEDGGILKCKDGRHVRPTADAHDMTGVLVPLREPEYWTSAVRG